MSILKTLKILDEDGTLSLSHIAVCVTLISLAALKTPISLLAFFISLINFNLKKLFALKKAEKIVADQKIIDKLNERINHLDSELNKLIIASTFSKLSR